MNLTKNLTKRSTLIYFILAFVISWGLIVLMTGIGNLPINPEISKDILPILYVSMLFGPAIGGLLMIGLVDGKNGFRKLGKAIGKCKVSVWWYVAAIFATPLLSILILLLLSLKSADFQFWAAGDQLIMPLISGVFIGLMVGTFEEIGWTGFAIPKLLKKKSVFYTGLWVGLIWGAWHFILFWEKDSFSGFVPFLVLIGRHFVWIPAFRILLVVIYKKTGSLFITILTHMSLVLTTTAIVPMTLTGHSLLLWLFCWGAALWLIVLWLGLKKPELLFEKAA